MLHSSSQPLSQALRSGFVEAGPICLLTTILHIRAACSLGCRHRLDQYGLRQLLVESQTGVADEADDVVMAGEKLDNAVLAEADFSQPIAELGLGAQLFNSDRDAGLDAI